MAVWRLFYKRSGETFWPCRRTRRSLAGCSRCGCAARSPSPRRSTFELPGVQDGVNSRFEVAASLFDAGAQ
jgi:hypothetical protein